MNSTGARSESDVKRTQDLETQILAELPGNLIARAAKPRLERSKLRATAARDLQLLPNDRRTLSTTKTC